MIARCLGLLLMAASVAKREPERGELRRLAAELRALPRQAGRRSER